MINSNHWKKRYIKDLSNIIVEKKFDEDSEQKLMTHFQNKPKKLYRYIGNTETRILNSIISGNVVLKNRTELNDPFDGIFQIGYGADEECRNRAYNNAMRDCNMQTFCQILNINSVEEFEKKLPEALELYKMADRRDTKSISEEIRLRAQLVGSCSFSEVEPLKYNLLWSHYANGGKGVCFEYDTTDWNDHCFLYLYPVVYQEAIPTLELHSFTPKNVAKQTLASLCTKLKMWEYEQEWRYLNLSLIFKSEEHKEEMILKIPNLKKRLEEWPYHIGVHELKEYKIKPNKIYAIKQVSGIREGLNMEIEYLDMYSL